MPLRTLPVRVCSSLLAWSSLMALAQHAPNGVGEKPLGAATLDVLRSCVVSICGDGREKSLRQKRVHEYLQQGKKSTPSGAEKLEAILGRISKNVGQEADTLKNGSRNTMSGLEGDSTLLERFFLLRGVLFRSNVDSLQLGARDVGPPAQREEFKQMLKAQNGVRGRTAEDFFYALRSVAKEPVWGEYLDLMRLEFPEFLKTRLSISHEQFSRAGFISIIEKAKGHSELLRSRYPELGTSWLDHMDSVLKLFARKQSLTELEGHLLYALYLDLRISEGLLTEPSASMLFAFGGQDQIMNSNPLDSFRPSKGEIFELTHLLKEFGQRHHEQSSVGRIRASQMALLDAAPGLGQDPKSFGQKVKAQMLRAKEVFEDMNFLDEASFLSVFSNLQVSFSLPSTKTERIELMEDVLSALEESIVKGATEAELGQQASVGESPHHLIDFLSHYNLQAFRPLDSAHDGKRIRVSAWSLADTDYGEGILSHEVGHIISNHLRWGGGIDKDLAERLIEFRSCLSRKHKSLEMVHSTHHYGQSEPYARIALEEDLRAEEDFADFVMSVGGESQKNFFCNALPRGDDGYDFFAMSKEEEEIRKHSHPLFRLLHVQSYRGFPKNSRCQELPEKIPHLSNILKEDCTKIFKN